MIEKILLVGDVHARPSELDDCQVLINQICGLADQARGVLFMGDLFDTHSIVHVDVMNFWRKAFTQVKDIYHHPATVLVGNHDYSSNGSGNHALASCADVAWIVGKPDIHGDKNLYMPYVGDNDVFSEIAFKHNKTDTIFCHATFDGAQYENGVYAHNGIDSDALPQKWFISGHIHKPAQFGKVVYTGASRWLNAGDVNQERYIWLMGPGPTFEAIPSNCRKKLLFTDSWEKPLLAAVNSDSKHDIIIHIIGPNEWIRDRVNLWKGFKIRTTVIEEHKEIVLSESQGIDTSYQKHFNEFESEYKPELAAMIFERLKIELRNSRDQLFR